MLFESKWSIPASRSTIRRSLQSVGTFTQHLRHRYQATRAHALATMGARRDDSLCYVMLCYVMLCYVTKQPYNCTGRNSYMYLGIPYLLYRYVPVGTNKNAISTEVFE